MSKIPKYVKFPNIFMKLNESEEVFSHKLEFANFDLESNFF